MRILTVFTLANFLYVFFAWPISFIVVIVVLLLAPYIAIVVIAVLVAMVFSASSLGDYSFFIFFFDMRLLAVFYFFSIITKLLATSTVTESSSRLALDSCAEPRAPVQALFTIGANEGLLARAFCFVRPEVGKFRFCVLYAIVPFLIPLLLDPRVKPCFYVFLTRGGNLPVVERLEALCLEFLLDIHVGVIEVLLLRF